jgi:hypothetical protein
MGIMIVAWGGGRGVEAGRNNKRNVKEQGRRKKLSNKENRKIKGLIVKKSQTAASGLNFISCSAEKKHFSSTGRTWKI